MTSIAINLSATSEQVIEFIDLEMFTKEFQKAYNDGKIWGCYYDEKGQVIAQDIWNEIHEDILTKD